jgi:hypothetical protein
MTSMNHMDSCQKEQRGREHEQTVDLTQMTQECDRTNAGRMIDVEYTFFTSVFMYVCVPMCLWSFLHMCSSVRIASTTRPQPAPGLPIMYFRMM